MQFPLKHPRTGVAASAIRTVPVLVLATAASSIVHAQALAIPKGTAQLEPVVVTAARGPQPIVDLVADVTVIGPDEIQQSGMDSLASLLQRQPGVEIVRNGGPGATSGIFLRGANASQTLVLIDGMRVSSSSSGATALEAIPLDQIDHIEILRGPASSLYGADAIGGVIQIFTRRGERGLRASASLGYGTYETSSGAAGISGGSALAQGSLQVSGRHSEGFNAITNPANFSYDPDRDGYRDGSVSASGALEVAPGHNLSLQLFRSRLDNQFDAGDSFNDRTITTLASWRAATADRLAPWWTSNLSAGEGDDRSVSKTGYGDYPFRTRQRQYAWQHDFTLPVGGLTLAAERREERVDSDSGFAVDARDTNSLTAIWRRVAGANALQANLRHDQSSQFGGRTTGAVAWGYRISPVWRVTASAGTAFRVPTFNDLYYPDYSNPDLRPETSRNVEAGIHAAGRAGDASWQAQAVGYYDRVRDLIVFQCDADFNCRPNNVADATLKGVTLNGDWRWRGASVHASIDLQSPTDDATGHLLPRRARRHAAFAYSQQAGPVRLTAEWVGSSQRYDDAENLRRLGGYGIVNLGAEWALAHGVTLFVRGDNVFDRNYELAADYATGGARIFAGARWQL
ncbi:MAG: TonB-dependent receptor domain-containing protein [Candidatus Levyibacteriota bacterium]